MLVARAFAQVEAGTLASFRYLEFIAATLGGWLAFGDMTDATTWLEVADILGFGLYVFHREGAVSPRTTPLTEGRCPMQDDRALRVASYNIRKAIGGDWRRDPSRILGVVRAIGADVVAMQEGDYRFRGRAPLFGAEQVTARSGLTAIDLDNGLPGLGWHGNLLLIGPRVRVVSVATRDLPGLEPRGTVTVDLEIAGRPVRVVAAHLALLPHHRRRQADLLTQSLGKSDTRPVIAVGDFNAWGRTPRSLSPFRDAMTEVICGPSYPARFPVAPLDRIFRRGALSAVASGVWRQSPAPVASDHLPIWADFRFD